MQRVRCFENTPRPMRYVSSSEYASLGHAELLRRYSHGEGLIYIDTNVLWALMCFYHMMLLRAPGIGPTVQFKPRVVNLLCLVSRRAKPTFCCAPTPGDREGMEETTPEYDPRKATRDVMSDSYGEGYATRSDEEGFGGVYGGNDPIENPGHRVNHPEYGKSQGSEVKEREKGRNLPEGAAATKVPAEREAGTN